MRTEVVGLLSAFVVLATGGPARAEWVRVETDKFIVYGQSGEKAVRDYALKLNTYDQMLRRFHPSTANRKPETKVQVVMVRNPGELRRARPGITRGAAGVYSATSEGVFAIAVESGSGLGGDDVIFHEYAHHFMLENFPVAYPAWYVEGFAEYFMTTEVRPNGITVGRYNEGRLQSLIYETWVPMEDLLSKSTGQTRSYDLSTYYGQAWLLTHYMRSDPARAQQLDKAMRAIAGGEDPVKAMQDATGMTLVQLRNALEHYSKLRIWTFRGDLPAPPSVTVTHLPNSADELFLDYVRLLFWPTGKVDAPWLADVRRKAALFPGDALAERTLARAEFVMGDVAAGETILKRRLEAHPEDVEDLLLAGTGQLMAGIREPAKRTARFRAARTPLIKAYQLDKTDFRILYGYSVSRSVEPGFPNENDINALIEDRALAPSVMETSYRAGMALLAKGRRDEAARILAPVLNNPHGGEAAEQARKALNEGRIGVVDIEPPGEEDPPKPPAK